VCGASLLVSNHSRDSLSSRLLASRTSAPPSAAFVPWGEVGGTTPLATLMMDPAQGLLLEQDVAHSGTHFRPEVYIEQLAAGSETYIRPTSLW